MNRDTAKPWVFLFTFSILGFVLFALTGCASMAHLLGVATDSDLAATTKTIHEVGSVFGPYGDLIATGISAVLVGTHEVYRNQTRKKALSAIKGP